MSEPLTQEQRDKLRKLAEAATPGPWSTGKSAVGDPPAGWCVDGDDGPVADYICGVDARYIAAASNAVVPLLDEVEQLEQWHAKITDSPFGTGEMSEEDRAREKAILKKAVKRIAELATEDDADTILPYVHLGLETAEEMQRVQHALGMDDMARMNHVADEVEALQARVAELEAERRWVSVEERMPDVGVEVVASGHLLRRKRRALASYADGRWFGVDFEVTHWMPLPAAPEGED